MWVGGLVILVIGWALYRLLMWVNEDYKMIYTTGISIFEKETEVEFIPFHELDVVNCRVEFFRVRGRGGTIPIARLIYYLDLIQGGQVIATLKCDDLPHMMKRWAIISNTMSDPLRELQMQEQRLSKRYWETNLKASTEAFTALKEAVQSNR